eukprot:6181075-Pleurochrysis_carterae.AAC.3
MGGPNTQIRAEAPERQGRHVMRKNAQHGGQAGKREREEGNGREEKEKRETGAKAAQDGERDSDGGREGIGLGASKRVDAPLREQRGAEPLGGCALLP